MVYELYLKKKKPHGYRTANDDDASNDDDNGGDVDRYTLTLWKRGEIGYLKV